MLLLCVLLVCLFLFACVFVLRSFVGIEYHGVGVVTYAKVASTLIDVSQVNNRTISVQFKVRGQDLIVIGVYAPQPGSRAAENRP